MASVELIKKPAAERKFYVYYNEWTGEILSVGTTERRDERAPHIVTYSEDAGRMLKGTRDERQYLVAESDDKELVLMAKSETIRIKALQESLFQIPKKKLTDWDIRVKVYTLNNKMSLEVNTSSIARLGNFKIRNEIRVESDERFCLYITKNNNPDFLVDTIEIDLEQLLTNHAIVYDIDHITDTVPAEDIALLTKRHFKNYQLEIVDDNYIFSAVGNSRYQNDQIHRAQVAEQAHIELCQNGDYIEFVSRVENDQFDSIGLFQRMFKYYVVGAQPDEFIDTIDVDLTKLRMGRTEKFRVDYNIDDVNFVYRNPKLITSIRKSK